MEVGQRISFDGDELKAQTLMESLVWCSIERQRCRHLRTYFIGE